MLGNEFLRQIATLLIWTGQRLVQKGRLLFHMVWKGIPDVRMYLE